MATKLNYLSHKLTHRNRGTVEEGAALQIRRKHRRYCITCAYM